MSDLEISYRRLLRVYPAGHRAAYEEEMVGVLMAGTEPGRRFPSPGDVIDLLRAGLTARLGGVFRTQRGTGWRDAAAVTGLIIAAMLAAVAGSRLLVGVRVFVLESPHERMELFGIRGLLLLDVSLRFAFWAAVCAAALFGLRRTAAGLAVAAAVVELGAVLWWLPESPVQSSIRLTWSLVTVGVAVAAFVVARRARPLPSLLGTRGLVQFSAAAAGLLVVRSVSELFFVGGNPWPVRLLEVALFVLAAVTILSVTPGVRARAAVLLVPAVTGPVTWQLALSTPLLYTADRGDLAALVFLVLFAPLLAFTAAVAVFKIWHRTTPTTPG
jgi:hypothetical protein